MSKNLDNSLKAIKIATALVRNYSELKNCAPEILVRLIRDELEADDNPYLDEPISKPGRSEKWLRHCGD